MRCPTGQPGFTLIEMVVAVGIMSIVIGLALPAVQSARESARRSVCQSNLHQIGLRSTATTKTTDVSRSV